MIYSEREFIVYKITNHVTGMIYIGVTSCGLKARYSQHKTNSKQGSKSPLHLDMVKYGLDSFSIEPIESIIAKDVMYANNLEFEYIKKLNTIYPNGYNKMGFGERKSYHFPNTVLNTDFTL